MSLKAKLHRYKAHMSNDYRNHQNEHEQADQHTKAYQSTKSASPSRMPSSISVQNSASWEAFGCVPFTYDGQTAIVREVRYPLNYRHANVPVQRLFEAVQWWQKESVVHPLSTRGVDASQLLFFDIETTGLHSGVGNIVFLIGYAQLTASECIVRQYFLPQPGNEVAFYYAFLSDVRDDDFLVTYNGKAFDWPQVKTKHTLIREKLPRLPKFGHYDLLHAARRLWKDELPSCRLSIVEEQKLRFRREEDTPGSLAPLLYYEFVRNDDPKTIFGVFQHNEHDLLSLITLYIHISGMLLHPEKYDANMTECLHAGRWWMQMKQWNVAVMHYQHILSVSDHHPRHQHYIEQAQLALGTIFKKRKQYDKATDVWEQLCEQGCSVYAVQGWIELAKLYEHQWRDYERAYRCVQQALKIGKEERSTPQNRVLQRSLANIDRRLERLQQKARKQSSGQ